MYIPDDTLKKFLLDGSIVSLKDIEIAERDATSHHRPLGDVLVANNTITVDELRRTMATALGIPFVSLKGMNIPLPVLSLVPEPIARRNNIIAYKQEGNELEIAMLDVDDLTSIDFIKKKTQLKVLARLTDTDSLKGALKLYQQSLNDNLGDVLRRESQTVTKTDGTQDPSSSDSNGESAIRIVDTLLRHASAQNASDIHIEPYETALIIRYRIDGILHDAMELPKSTAAAITARIKVLSALKLDEKRLPQDGRFSVTNSSEKVSFRVSILPTYYGEKIVMRLLRDSVSGFTLESIGFHGAALDRMHDAMKKTTGLILTTGPTGAGKSTTLYTILDILNTPRVNISTIEDPIEYQMPRINQTQVRPDIGFTFSTGLRSLVRQDPDIVMVGEIRDKETITLAVNAALTGHLVLSTLHTNSAAGAIARMLEMGVEPFLLVSTLRVIIGQRLVRKLTPEKQEYTLSRDEQAQLEHISNPPVVLKALKDEKIVNAAATWKNVPFYHAGESIEHPTGYASRLGIYEVLPVSASIKELIMGNKTGDDIEKQARAEGMLTMSEDGIFKAAQGITSIEEVMRVITD
ncbi:MAG: Type secretion system protein [Candidatus Kaiserbacteria bacterium]|nr:Type secretion system protein [Candidatus Kaiserbacteria bacterium]